MSDEDETTNGSAGIRDNTEESEQEIDQKEIRFAHERDDARRYDADRKLYYQTFPLGIVQRMLDVDDKLEYREFDFCFKERTGDGVIWTRYRPFQKTAQLRDYLINTQPVSINVGPAGASPTSTWRMNFGFRKRWGDTSGDLFFRSELVLDIDLKDYNEVRTCKCTETTHALRRCLSCGKLLRSRGPRHLERHCNCDWQRFKNQICSMCWSFARSAMVLIDYILKKKWGIYEFVFVFSGGKGFHCWILDQQVRSFSIEQRKELVASFNPWATHSNLYTENCKVDPIFGTNDFDDLVMQLFIHNVLRTGIFNIAHEHTGARIIEYFGLEQEQLGPKLELLWKVCEDCIAWESSGEETWKALMDFNYRFNDPAEALTIQRRFVYAYTFPRIDELVSTQISHARKLPFSPHPTSHAVAIPILPLTPERIFEFEPSACPNLTDFDAINDVTLQLEQEIAFQNAPLDVLYCESKFPPIPNMLDLLEQGNEKTIFRQFRAWCELRVKPTHLFPDNESYWAHCRETGCETCDERILYDHHNTLKALVQRSAWLGSVYKSVLAECMTLAFLERCETFGFCEIEASLQHRISHLLHD